MDVEDDDVFMDIDPKILSGETTNRNALDQILFGEDVDIQENSKNISSSKRWFECTTSSISKTLCVDAGSLVQFVCNVLNSNNPQKDSEETYITLFDYLFEKTTALDKCRYELFNFMFNALYDLEYSISTPSYKAYETKSAENILQFFQYILDYIETCLQNGNTCQNIASQIWNDFNQLKLSLKPLKSIASSAISHQSLCLKQFHLFLNIHLYYLITFFKLLSIEKGHSDTQYTQYTNDTSNISSESCNFNMNKLKSDIVLLMVQLVELSLKSFNKLSQPDDIYHLSPFKCDCIPELWLILKFLCGKIHPDDKNELFWKCLETVFDLVEKSSEHDNSCADDAQTGNELPQQIICSKPYLFIIWFLKHLLCLDVSPNEINGSEKFSDECELTEKTVKKLTNANTSNENELRIILTFLHSIVSIKPNCKPDILTSLWEYFHKRLNSNFILPSMPFAYSLSSLNSNHGIVGLLSHVEQLTAAQKRKGEENSYILFLRLLGFYLVRNNHEQRIWNQIKGRMYSKFSPNKLRTLTEQGILNLGHLFILLFYLKGNQEFAKIQTFLKMISSVKDEDSKTREILLRTHFVFILINIRNNISIDNTMITSVMSFIEHSSQNETILRIYLHSVKDILNESEDLTLGQHQLLDSWIQNVLKTKSTTVISALFDVFTLVLTKLRPYHPIDRDSQLATYYLCAKDNVLPHLQTEADCMPDTLQSMTQFLTAFTLFSMNGGVHYKHEAIFILNKLLVKPNVNFELKMNFIQRLLSCEDMSNFSLTAFIPTIDTLVTQCYLISLILSEQEDGLKRYVEAHYLHKIRQKYAVDGSQCLRETLLSSNEEALTQFLRDLCHINSSISDPERRNQFQNEVNTLFNIEEHLRHILNTHENSSNGKSIVTNVYTSVGLILFHTGHLLYRKSKPNWQLQCFLDTLLLQFQVRAVQFKLSASTTHALRCSFHIYIDALMKLSPASDAYVTRVLRELLLIYLPRLINKTPYETRFSLSKCFNKDATNDAYLLSVLTSLFMRKKCKVSDKNTHEYLVFLQDLLNENSQLQFLFTFLQSCLAMLLHYLLSLNEVDLCRSKIRSVLMKCFARTEIQTDPGIKSHVLGTLNKLTNEHLAFSFGPLFQVLNFLLQSCCPNIIAEFRREFLVVKIKDVEVKRGVAQDRALRNHLEQLDRNIKKVLLVY